MKSTKSNKSSNWRKQSLTAYIPMPKGRGLTPHLITVADLISTLSAQQSRGIPIRSPFLSPEALSEKMSQTDVRQGNSLL